ncbi:hypothetical protein EMPG_14714 [Blastomyces silverae]|uniref:Uncharacterized protein n=1 Tax=Blastomyces silverae TaxID=2060906 RepID=A0A0H1BEJ8_9EURO|nr:hypothetical protein EMPG_14714 [Blastomyces silverae]
MERALMVLEGKGEEKDQLQTLGNDGGRLKKSLECFGTLEVDILELTRLAQIAWPNENSPNYNQGPWYQQWRRLGILSEIPAARV